MMPSTESRSRKRSAAPLPASIATDADLAAHVAALLGIAPQFGALLDKAGPLPLRRTEPGFRGLFWIINGQQISTAAARAIFSRVEAALGTVSADRVSEVEDAFLKTAGMSGAKIRTMRAVSEAILAGELDLGGLLELSPDDAIAHLTRVKGIGRWTAEVYLLFALGHPDIFPAGDLALKEGFRLAFDMAERPAEKALAARAEDWRPYRAAAARVLWAYYAAMKRVGNAAPV